MRAGEDVGDIHAHAHADAYIDLYTDSLDSVGSHPVQREPVLVAHQRGHRTNDHDLNDGPHDHERASRELVGNHWLVGSSDADLGLDVSLDRVIGQHRHGIADRGRAHCLLRYVATDQPVHQPDE